MDEMEFKAKFVDGELKIIPNVETKDGNVTVHVLNPEVESKAKNVILSKLAKGESIKKYLIEDGVRSIQPI